MATPQARFGRYVTSQLLGRGGGGEVWKAYDTGMARWIALKILKTQDPAQVKKFKNEARTAAKLVHPNIVAVYEVGEDKGRHFIAMQLVVGRTLRHFNREEVRAVAELLRDAARAVHHAHGQGIVHRDLKPDNILVEESDASRRALVTDFGLARSVEGPHSASSPSLSGTVAYMPPEQAKGGDGDARSDVYSLGATLYEALQGRPPFDGRTIFEVLRKVVEEDPLPVRGELGLIVAKAMEKEPGRRYATAAEFADDLDRWLKGEPVVATKSSVVYRLRKRLWKRRGVAVAALACVVLAAAGAAVIVPKLRAEAAERERTERYLKAFDEAKGRMREFRLAARTAGRREAGRAAAAALEAALEIDPRRAGAWVELGRVRRMLGEDASECWEKALGAEPGHAEAFFERARQRLDAYIKERGHLGAVARAELPEEKALRESGEADAARAKAAGIGRHLLAYLEGCAAFGRGDFPAAEAAFTEYLRTVDWEADPFKHRGWTRFKIARRPGEAENRGWLSKADEDLRRVVELSPGSTAALIDLGLFYRESREPDWVDLAVGTYEKALKIDPKNAVALKHLGVLYRGQKKHDKALEMFGRALALNENDWAALVNRAITYRDAGDKARALADHDRAVEVAPREESPWRTRGYLHQSEGRWAEAEADYTKAESIDPKQSKTYEWRGEARMKLRKFAEAAADFEKAMELDPENRERLQAQRDRALRGE
jgi:tetratricopeptide (TPR) repeat protein/predicted Ser/Thr protein kinase